MPGPRLHEKEGAVGAGAPQAQPPGAGVVVSGGLLSLQDAVQISDAHAVGAIQVTGSQCMHVGPR